MNGTKRNKISHPIRRLILLCIGLSVMAFGVAFSIKASLGTSPISSLPYVTSAISGMSVGTTTVIVNCLLILIQIGILRRQYDRFQLLQFPAVILFGGMIDLAGIAMERIPCSGYLQQWILCAAGIVLLALGVSIEVAAGLVTVPGEGIVLAVCKVAPIKFSNMKMILDITLVCISILLSLLFLGRLEGVREGTVAAAVCVGLITKQTNKLMKKAEPVLLK